MSAKTPSLAKLQPNPHWAKLPLFERKGWKRYRFDQIAENFRESVMPTPEDSKNYIGLEHMETGSLHVRRWGSRPCKFFSVNSARFKLKAGLGLPC